MSLRKPRVTLPNDFVVAIAQARTHSFKTVRICLQVDRCKQASEQMYVECDAEAAFDYTFDLERKAVLRFGPPRPTWEQPSTRLAIKFQRPLDQWHALGLCDICQRRPILGLFASDADDPGFLAFLLNYLDLPNEIEMDEVL